MRLRGSYTVEAAAVMGAVLLAVCLFFQTAFTWRADTVGAMKLQETVVYLRYTKKDTSLSYPAYHVSAFGKGKKAEGKYQGKRKKLTIEWDRYEPESFIRMISLIVE